MPFHIFHCYAEGIEHFDVELIVVMLQVVIPTVIMLQVVIPTVIMLNVVRLRVVAPLGMVD